MSQDSSKKRRTKARHALRTPTLFLTWTQSLRRYGLKSTAKKTTRAQRKVKARQAVLQMEMRHLLLLEKELEQEQRRIQHRLEELSPTPELERYESLVMLGTAMETGLREGLEMGSMVNPRASLEPLPAWFPAPDSTRPPSSLNSP